MISDIFKSLLRAKPMIFLLISFQMFTFSQFSFAPNPWFFCPFPLYIMVFKSLLQLNPIIFLSFLIWFDTNSNLYFGTNHDFSAHFLYIYHKFQMFTSAQPHDFSSFSHIIWYKFKSLLCSRPMIFLMANLYFGTNPWFFCSFPSYIIFFLSFWQIFTSRQTHDFSAHFLCIL